MSSMDSAHIIILVMMLITFAVLLVGVAIMTIGGPINEKYGNKLMVARVSLQGITILLLGLFFLIGK